jgi:hypothetical protein
MCDVGGMGDGLGLHVLSTFTLEKPDGLAALVFVATERFSWISDASRSSAIRSRQRVIEERSKGGNRSLNAPEAA